MSTCPMCSHDPPTTRPGTKDLFVEGGDGELAGRVATALQGDLMGAYAILHVEPQERLYAAGIDMVVEDHGWHWYVRKRTAFEHVARQTTAGMLKAGRVRLCSTPKRNPGLIASLYSRPSMAAQIANAEHERREIDAALAGPQEPVTQAQIDGFHIGIDLGVDGGGGVTTICTACRGVDGCMPGCSRSVIGKGRGWGRTAELAARGSGKSAISHRVARLAYREGTCDINEGGPTEDELAQLEEQLERRATRCVSGSAARSCGVP